MRAGGMANTPIEDAALDEATAYYARPRESKAERVVSMIVFRLGAEWFALSTRVLDRVAAVQRVHSLPHRRGGAALGLVNVGGDIIVHVSLAGLLRISSSESSLAAIKTLSRLVVLSDARGRFAATVDEVWGTRHFDAVQLRPVPHGVARTESSFTTAILQVDEHSAGCLDETRVMQMLAERLS
ncbi:hypothetical protein BH09GEM1_BH09GEM1_26650 [soil metagenome]